LIVLNHFRSAFLKIGHSSMLIALTEVFANTPAALLLLQRFAWQRLPGGAPSYDSNGRAYLRLYADDLDELKHSATAERLTWQAAPKAKPKE
jgi:hypothetical protein